MPLLHTHQPASDVCLGIWKITESIDELKLLCQHSPQLYTIIDSIGHQHRKREILAIYALLMELTHQPHLIIQHDEYRRPIIEGYNISISHTKEYASIILSKEKRVAVDIEYMSNRVEKIVSKFIRNDEMVPTLLHKLINWCSKETCYKFFYKSGLQYHDMKVVFTDDADINKAVADVNTTVDNLNAIVVENLKDKMQIPIYSMITPQYILTYTFN